MKKWMWLAALGAAVLALTLSRMWNQRQVKEASYSKTLLAMDTVMSLTAYGERAEEAVEAAAEEIQRLDDILSTEKDSSEISQLNAAGSFSVSEDTAQILKKAQEVYESTGGLFDVSIYPLMQLWGFPTQEYHVPTQEELTETLSLVDGSGISLDGDLVTLSEGQKIDLGGIAKGYTSAKIMRIFASYGITSGIVSLGGNVQTLGARTDGTAWQIGIQDPQKTEDSSSVLLVLETKNQAVITSGGYERYFEENGENYIHILDPRTGYPADSGLISATIVSEDGMLADALSTSIYIMGVEEASRYWREHGEDFEMLLVDEGSRIYVTEGLQDQIKSGSVQESLLTVIKREDA